MKIFKGLSRAQNKIFWIMQGGVILEYFDLYLYIHLAPLIVDSYFLPSSTNTLAIYLLTIFSVIFIRFLGVAIGGYIGDVYGRKPSMIISISLTGLCCIGFAIIPGYETLGLLAIIFLVILRSLQSAASVNEIGCAMTYMTEIIRSPYNYFVTSLIRVNGYVGAVAALLIAGLVMKFYPEGWKALFLISGILAFICFYFRRKVPESNFFVKEIQINTTGERRIAYLKEIKKILLSKTPLIQAGMDLGFIIFFYLVYVHCSILLKNTYGLTNVEIISNNAIVAFVEWISILFFVCFMLKYHPLKIMKYRFFISCTCIIITPFWLHFVDSTNGIFLFQCVLISFAITSTPASSIVIQLYPIHCRVSIRNMVYSLAKMTYPLFGMSVLFIGEYMTHSIAWSILALIVAFLFYQSLKHLINKYQHRYNTIDYRKAMKLAHERNLRDFHHVG